MSPLYCHSKLNNIILLNSCTVILSINQITLFTKYKLLILRTSSVCEGSQQLPYSLGKS